MAKVKYVENNPQYGIDIDWKMIYKEYFKTLKYICGNAIDTFYVPAPPFNRANWFIDLSHRSIGKTTNYLLLGLLVFKHYGLKFEYIRLTKEGIMPKNSATLFDTLKRFGYIPYIFGERYNDIESVPRGWVLVNRDENGTIIDKSPEFCHMHCLEEKEVDAEKSVYNSDACLIIVDEFMTVGGGNNENQFIFLCQLHSSIRRQRLNVKTVLLANTINKYCLWFNELGIQDDIMKLRIGEEIFKTSVLGVPLWIHYAQIENVNVNDKRLTNNLLYYGFANKRLNSITGLGEWETRVYRHLPNDAHDCRETELLTDIRIYFELNGKLLRWRVYDNERIGLYALVSPYYSNPRADSLILKLTSPDFKNEIFGLPLNGLGKFINELKITDRTFYSTNDVGAMYCEWFKQFHMMS